MKCIALSKIVIQISYFSVSFFHLYIHLIDLGSQLIHLISRLTRLLQVLLTLLQVNVQVGHSLLVLFNLSYLLALRNRLLFTQSEAVLNLNYFIGKFLSFSVKNGDLILTTIELSGKIR